MLHPNGLSLAVDNIAAESPTKTELGTAANWSLKYNTKNVKMGLIKSVSPEAVAAAASTTTGQAASTTTGQTE